MEALLELAALHSDRSAMVRCNARRLTTVMNKAMANFGVSRCIMQTLQAQGTVVRSRTMRVAMKRQARLTTPPVLRRESMPAMSRQRKTLLLLRRPDGRRGPAEPQPATRNARRPAQPALAALQRRQPGATQHEHPAAPREH